MGLLVEPVDISKYEFIRLPLKEQWGVLVRADSQLAEKEFVTSEDLRGVPLLMVRRELVKNELANWFGDSFDQLEIAATYNLIVNAAFMVEQGLGISIVPQLLIQGRTQNLAVRPLKPRASRTIALAIPEGKPLPVVEAFAQTAVAWVKEQSGK